jgi:hypothetical protein
MEEGNLAILVDAKTEYTKQLVNCLKHNLYLSFYKLFAVSKQKCLSENKPNMVLNKFQEFLREVPNWNQDKINTEYDLIVTMSQCDWLEELITAVIISHTRILTSINFNKNKTKINLKIPKTTHFVHKCFIDVARYFWKNAYLFDDRVNNYEIQKNRRETEIIIEQSINETIRKELPVKHILKEYLGDDYKEDKPSIDETESTQNNINLRNMVMKEIKSCTNEQLILINKQNDVAEELITQPVAEPVVAPVAEPVVAPVAEPVVTPVAEPVVEQKNIQTDSNINSFVETPTLEKINASTEEINISDTKAPVLTHVSNSLLTDDIKKTLVQIENNSEPSITDLNIEELKLNNLEPLNLNSSPELNNVTIKTEEPLKQTSNSVKTILINTSSKNDHKLLSEQIPNKDSSNEIKNELSNYLTKKDYTFF